MNPIFKDLDKYLSEALGSFGLILFGLGAVMANEIYDLGFGGLEIGLAFGMAVMAMIYAFGEISGAHINPAVTIAFWVSGRFKARLIPGYILSQIAGGYAACLLLISVYPETVSLTVTRPASGLEASLVLEFVMTFVLMLVIMHVSTGSKETGIMAGIAIGATVGLEAMIFGSATGASMNPMRSLVPATLSGDISHLWLYFLGPIAGAITATFTCRVLRTKDCCPPPSLS